MENDSTAEQSPSASSPTLKLSDEQAELELKRLSLVKCNRLTGRETPDEIHHKHAVWLAEHKPTASQRAVCEAEQTRQPVKFDPNEMVLSRMRRRLEASGVKASSMNQEQMLPLIQKLEREESQKRAAEVEQFQRGRAIEQCRRFWSESGCPRRHMENLSAFEDSSNDKAKKIRDLLVKQAGFSAGYLVALLGTRGTGKTQIAVSTIRECCEAGYRSKYVKALDLFRDIRSAFTPVKRGDAGESEADAIQRWINVDLLVIDEVHQRGGTEWEQNAFINLLDQRYDRRACTILLANQSPADFSAAMGDSIVSRIHETGQVFVCSWPSYRTPGQWLQGEHEPRNSRVKNWSSETYCPG